MSCTCDLPPLQDVWQRLGDSAHPMPWKGTKSPVQPGHQGGHPGRLHVQPLLLSANVARAWEDVAAFDMPRMRYGPHRPRSVAPTASKSISVRDPELEGQNGHVATPRTTMPKATMQAAASRLDTGASLSQITPISAAKITEVSRRADTAPKGARVLAKSTSA